MMKRIALTATAAAFLMGASTSVFSRDYIDVVGSSTVYPFSTTVAETYGKKSGGKTPKIESTGSGGGMKLFCAGKGVDTPDITNASRRIKYSEYKKCQSNGVKEIVEVQIGYDGIAIANSKAAARFELSRKELFLALAKEIPTGNAGELIENPYQRWSEINPALPNSKIEVLGPPPTSGTRDAFAELVLEGGCQSFGWIKQLKKESKAAKKQGDKAKAKRLKSHYKETCHSVREDGAYIEAGENDNLIVEKLRANPKALGVFGFSFLDQNSDKVQGAVIDEVEISFDAVADGSYPVSRPLYFYVKKSHVGKVPGIVEFIEEFTSEDAWGEEGYLTDKGLIPLPDEARQKMADSVNGMVSLEMSAE